MGRYSFYRSGIYWPTRYAMEGISLHKLQQRELRLVLADKGTKHAFVVS